ncbi:efflux RND transporter periplasmic adaptor subunit [Amphritea sp. 1_MG-2023]|uniref:efflux RND transporter periplasmic adaptor subunit n=1 Tax=Amphritea sp. 1_MG-2023 TaxID=3062670 RepID=UPI0026E12661|nr:efflux RND transporter periplasmic adaptor subunit [Amphritea sp. 1_MG-2023]MDO6564818.1 efflux RND transporter periplasmic adaptor subunit [Amphritea sp. 1_MG-2023]
MSGKLITLLCSAMIVLSGCDHQPAAKARSAKPHLVEVMQTSAANIELQRIRTGSLEAFQTINIYTQAEGIVKQILPREGDRVKRDQLLVTLDAQLLKAQLQRARAVRQQAETELTRIKGLIQRNLTARSELTSRETDLAVAQADEKVIATRLGYTRIRSPIDGVITARHTEPGNLAEQSSHLLTIADISRLRLKVDVSELLLNQLSIDMPVEIQIDALQNRQQQPFAVSGKISRIYPTIDPATRSGTLEISLNPAPQGARPGQFARVKFSIARQQVMLLPIGSLRQSADGSYVYIIDRDNKVQIRSLETGLKTGEQIEILTGLQPEEQVITRGFTNLKPGMQVTVVNRVSN